MDEERKYYVYIYLREDGTPYYVGKGTGYRAYDKHRRLKPPEDLNRIIFHAENLTEEEAFAIEIEQIKKYGRVDNDTGILRNLTDGGEGSSGVIPSEETRAKMRAKMKEVYSSPEVRAKLSTATKRSNAIPEVKAKRTAALNTPEARAKRTAALNTPEARGKRIAALNTPEVRAKRIAAMNTPEVRAKMSASVKKSLNTPEMRAKFSAVAKEREAKKRAEKLAAQANLQPFLEEPSIQSDSVAEKQQS